MSAYHANRWWNLFREIGDATVMYVDLTPHVAREASAFLWLDDKERLRYRQFMYSGPRRRFVLCRAALRAILCGKLGCGNEQLSFRESCYGKPFAVVHETPVPISFNVSHSGKHGLIAFAPVGRLGVDIEEILPRRNLEGLIEDVFGPGEQYDLKLARGCQKTRLFLRLWTTKEALLKAIGMGLAFDMSRFEVPSALRHGTKDVSVFELPQIPAVRWRIEYIGNREFAAAIAHEIYME